MLLKIGLPVQSDRTAHVALVVCSCVDVDLENPYCGILGVTGEPVCFNEHIIRIGSHDETLQRNRETS